jgi:hypothetical protein
LGFGLNDENKEIRLQTDVGTFGPSLSIYDEKGTIRFLAGKPTAIARDRKQLGYPESSLMLLGPDGDVIWSAIK